MDTKMNVTSTVNSQAALGLEKRSYWCYVRRL